MANLSGTNSKDIIRGTASADTINGLGGNDILYGLGGNDVVNGGDGNDDLYGEAAFYQGKYYLLGNIFFWQDAQNEAVSLGGNLVTINDAAENQFLTDTFGNEGRLWIGLTDEQVEGIFQWINGEAFTYNNWAKGEPNDFNNNEDYVEFNFLNPGIWNDTSNNTPFSRKGIIEILASVIIAGNDTLNGGNGNDRLFGGFGNDILNGGAGFDTANYATLTEAISLLATGIVNKGTAGTDKLINVERIIAPLGKNNLIDTSTSTGSASINVDLANKNLTVNGLATPLSFTVENFVNVIGTTQNDTITGDQANNQMTGGEGNDSVFGNEGNDTLVGGQGDDTLNGGAGIDTLDYSAFTDAIVLQGRGFVDKGAAGIDRISDLEVIIGAVGQANRIDASNGLSTTTSLIANLGSSSLTVNGLPGIGSLSFTVQNFVNISGTTQGDNLTGNNLANEIVGNSGNDTIRGNNGDDLLDGSDGNDLIFGGNNNDIISGGLGADSLVGDNGNDLLFGDLGDDTLRGNAGDDFLDGGAGKDSLLGGNNNDIIFGDSEEDKLFGESGDDILSGDSGNDQLSGGDGNDELNGGTEADLLLGGNGNDRLFGDSENDILRGDAGNDFLFGGQGNDILEGGLNNDTFVLALGNGNDTIQDFQDGFDKLGLANGLTFAQITILGSGSNTLIRSGSATLATILNVNSSLFSSIDFITVDV